MRHNPTLFMQLVERLNAFGKRRLLLHEYEFSIAQSMQKRDSQGLTEVYGGWVGGCFFGAFILSRYDDSNAEYGLCCYAKRQK